MIICELQILHVQSCFDDLKMKHRQIYSNIIHHQPQSGFVYLIVADAILK